MWVNICFAQDNAINSYSSIMDGDSVSRESDDTLDVILIWVGRSDKYYDIAASRGMKQVGPLIYQDKLFIVQAWLHAHALNVKVLYRLADDKKHQHGEYDCLDDFTN